jgi:hypothetical protein
MSFVLLQAIKAECRCVGATAVIACARDLSEHYKNSFSSIKAIWKSTLAQNWNGSTSLLLPRLHQQGRTFNKFGRSGTDFLVFYNQWQRNRFYFGEANQLGTIVKIFSQVQTVLLLWFLSAPPPPLQMRAPVHQWNEIVWLPLLTLHGLTKGHEQKFRFSI